MSSYFVQTSPEIFKDPKSFAPDRWLEGDSAELDKWLVAFGKGPRQCIGKKYVHPPPSSIHSIFSLLAYMCDFANTN